MEQLIDELSESYTIVMVTHNMQQAARAADRTAFFHMGDLVEVDSTDQIFTKPQDQAYSRLHYRTVWISNNFLA